LFIFLIFRKFLQGVKKYTKKEKQVYQEKLKNQALKQDRKDKNKVVRKLYFDYF
jgi:SOS response regulatory protein OraA/RecX